MRDKSTVKFKTDFDLFDPITAPALTSLMAERNQLFDRGLIGVYLDGPSLGNLRMSHSTAIPNCAEPIDVGIPKDGDFLL